MKEITGGFIKLDLAFVFLLHGIKRQDFLTCLAYAKKAIQTFIHIAFPKSEVSTLIFVFISKSLFL